MFLYGKRRIVCVTLITLLLAGLMNTVFSQDSSPQETYPNAQRLVDADWLAEHLDDDGMRILDIRSAREYNAGHIPGAVNIPVEQISSTIDRVSLEFDPDEVQETLNAAGLTPDTTAIIYDNLGMMNSARMFWTLEYVGHQDARVLDGGWNAWVEADYEISTDVPDIEPTDYPVELDESKLVTAEELVTLLDDPNVVIVDARSPQEYTGEVALADRGGRIPGAVNLTWLDLLTGGDTLYTIESGWQESLTDDDVEVFLPASDIQSMLDALNITRDKQIITYCQSFWRGAHVYFLLRLMGFDDVRGYDGSWSEWGNNPDLPIETG